MKPPTAPEMRKIMEERRAHRERFRALNSNTRIAVIGIIGLPSHSLSDIKILPAPKPFFKGVYIGNRAAQ